MTKTASLCVSLQDSIDLLLDAVKTSNEDLAQTWKKSEQWATIEQLCSESQNMLNIHPETTRHIFHLTFLFSDRSQTLTFDLSRRHSRRSAIEFPWLRCYGRPLGARLVLRDVVLSALHLHEPTRHRALRDVQPAAQLGSR